MNIRIVRSTCAVVLLGTSFLVPRGVLAAQQVSTCGATCTGNCELSANLACSSGTAVTLTGSGDLDFKGHSIVCTGQCANAVKMTSANHTVFSSVVNGQVPVARITGVWAQAITCGGFGNTQVRNVNITGFWATSGIALCSSVSSSVLINEPFVDESGVTTRTPVCILQKSYANSDLVFDNYIDGCLKAIVRVPGGPATNLTIIGNVINYRDPGAITSPQPSQVAAIYMVDSVAKPTAVLNNIIVGDSPNSLIIAIPNTQVDYAQNLCESRLANCATGIAMGQFDGAGLGFCYQ